DDAGLQAEMTAAMAANAGAANAGTDSAAAPEPAPSEAAAPAASSSDDDEFGVDFDTMLDAIAPVQAAPADPEAGPESAAKPWHLKVRPHAG
ncbi:hypothetical protein ABTN34_17310, partial [Acinetobacter baumannii]